MTKIPVISIRLKNEEFGLLACILFYFIVGFSYFGFMNSIKGVVWAFALFLMVIPDLKSQWNAIAGYEISNADAGGVNQVLQAFNMEFDHTVSLTDIRILHGFTAGLRYHYDLGAFELTYNRRFTRRIGDEYLGLDSRMLTARSNVNFFYEIRTFSFTSEFGRAITIGASIDYNTYLTEMDYVQASIRNVKIKQRPLGSRFFIGTHIANRPNLSFSVRAFYQTLWSGMTADQLSRDLNLEEIPCENCNFQPSTFGLTILINNGRQ